MAPNPAALAHRLEGRLFSHEGRMCMVIATDPLAGCARISCSIDGRPLVFELPIEDVSLRLAVSPPAEGHSSVESNDRIVEKPEGWFFVAREGTKGPYPSVTAANEALRAHIISLQTTTSAYR